MRLRPGDVRSHAALIKCLVALRRVDEAVHEGADGPSIRLATEKVGPVSQWRPWTATLDASEAP